MPPTHDMGCVQIDGADETDLWGTPAA